MVIDFPVPIIIPGQGEFVSDIPAGDGKIATLFYSVATAIPCNGVIWTFFLPIRRKLPRLWK
jgi:hypothetical protein